jgi:hypothetical protein
MKTIYIIIERDRDARSSQDGARFRVKAFARPGGPALLMSTRLCSSVTKAKSDAEELFGLLEWREPSPDAAPEVRASAIVELG